jgi:hypothetical protein
MPISIFVIWLNKCWAINVLCFFFSCEDYCFLFVNDAFWICLIELYFLFNCCGIMEDFVFGLSIFFLWISYISLHLLENWYFEYLQFEYLVGLQADLFFVLLWWVFLEGFVMDWFLFYFLSFKNSLRSWWFSCVDSCVALLHLVDGGSWTTSFLNEEKFLLEIKLLNNLPTFFLKMSVKQQG